MAKNDPDGLIKALLAKGESQQKASRSQWEEDAAEVYRQMEEDGEFDEYKDEPMYHAGGVFNRKYFDNPKNKRFGIRGIKPGKKK